MNQWRKWTSTQRVRTDGESSHFETDVLKGRIGDGRFIGVNPLCHKQTGMSISGDSIVSRHGLLTLDPVFTHLFASME